MWSVETCWDPHVEPTSPTHGAIQSGQPWDEVVQNAANARSKAAWFVSCLHTAIFWKSLWLMSFDRSCRRLLVWYPFWPLTWYLMLLGHARRWGGDWQTSKRVAENSFRRTNEGLSPLFQQLQDERCTTMYFSALFTQNHIHKKRSLTAPLAPRIREERTPSMYQDHLWFRVAITRCQRLHEPRWLPLRLWRLPRGIRPHQWQELRGLCCQLPPLWCFGRPWGRWVRGVSPGLWPTGRQVWAPVNLELKGNDHHVFGP